MRTHGAFILARYSTDRQNPDSIEVQVEKCTNWCNENNVPILGVFADMAVSGMKSTRPQYELMMQQLRQNMADMVVIYDQSRMFRKMTAWFAFRDELEEIGVTVISVTQPMIGKDLRDPTNFLAEGSIALFNQIWALQTRQKVMEKMKYMARSGLHTGGNPALGYAVEEGKLVICEPEAAIVRRIFSEYAAGRKYKEIIDGLNADGLTTRAGNSFGTNSLHDLLKNEKYIGTLIYGKSPKRADGKRNSHGEVPADAIRIENAIPAIVDRDIWDAVQTKLAANKRDKAGRPNTVRNYPLKGKVFCGECGAALVHSSSKTSKSRYHYYACSGKQRLRNCEMMPIKMDELERIVIESTRATLNRPGNIQRVIRIMRDVRERTHSESVAYLEAMVERRQEINRQLERATAAILNGLNSPTLSRKIQELEQEKTILEHNMRKLKVEMDSISIPEGRMEDILTMINGNDESAFAMVARVEVSRTDIVVWTILDIGPDGTFDGANYGKKSTVEIQDECTCSVDVEFTDIVGVGSPAPRISINSGMLKIEIQR